MSGPGAEKREAKRAREGPARAEGAFTPSSRGFLRHAALWLMLAITGGLVAAGIADSLLHRLATFIQIIIVSLFLVVLRRLAPPWRALVDSGKAIRQAAAR